MEELIRGIPAKNAVDDANEQISRPIFVIRLPESRIMRVASRSLFLAMIIVALPSISSFFRDSSNGGALYESDEDSGIAIDDAIFRDLLDEGLIKKGQKGFCKGAADDASVFLKESGIDLTVGDHLDHQVFDFVFASTFREVLEFDGGVKKGGLIISPLTTDPLTELRLLRNHKIVYIRRFKNAVVVAMRRSLQTISKIGCGDPSSKQVLFNCASQEEKKAALKGLEDAYLEPPRQSPLTRKSSSVGRKIKFLPDLLNDSLDEYPRRVFISDELRALDWFHENYPTRDQAFEAYNLDIVTNYGVDELYSPETGVSAWLTKNVKHEDYVVMKAEAQVVEEMIRDKTLCLVDELFLECKNQWQDGEDNGTKRAYWQCLTLYGKVRDKGIAVHQWWN